MNKKFISGRKLGLSASKAVNSKTKRISSPWLTNAVKSIGLASKEVFKDITPNLYEVTSAGAKTVGQLVSLTKRTNSGQAATALLNNKIIRDSSSVFKYAIEDLKSGKLWNEDRATDIMMGNMGLDFDLEEGTDFSDWGADDESPDVNIQVNNNQSPQFISQVSEEYRRGSIANLKGQKALMDSFVAVSSANMLQQQEIGNQVLSSLNNITALLGATNDFMNNTLGTFVQNMTGYMEKTGRFMEEQYDNSSSKVDPFTTSKHGKTVVNFGQYGEYVKGNVSKAFKNSTLGMFADLATDENMLKMMLSNPIGGLMTMGMTAMIPKDLKKSLKDMDKVFGEWLTDNLIKLSGFGKGEHGIVGGFKQLLGKIFGIDTDRHKDGFDLSGRLTNESAVFDKITRHTIVEIIPKYLRESTSYLEGIAKAIGQNTEHLRQNSEVFDVKSGKYYRKKAFDRQFERQINDAALNELNESEIAKYLRSAGVDESKVLNQRTGRTYKDAGITNKAYQEAIDKILLDIEKHGTENLIDTIDRVLAGESEGLRKYTSTRVRSLIRENGTGKVDYSNMLADLNITSQKARAGRNKAIRNMEANPDESGIWSYMDSADKSDRTVDELTRQTNDRIINALTGNTTRNRNNSNGTLFDIVSDIRFILYRAYGNVLHGETLPSGIRTGTTVANEPAEAPRLSRNELRRIGAQAESDTTQSFTPYELVEEDDLGPNPGVKNFVKLMLQGKGGMAFRSVLDGISDKAGSVFEDVYNKFYSSVISPLKKEFFGQRDVEGYSRGGLFSSVQNSLLDGFRGLGHIITGKEYKNSKGETIAADDSSIFGSVKTTFGEVKKSIIGVFSEGLKGWSTALFGTEEDREKNKALLDPKKVSKYMKDASPNAVIGAGIGAATGMLSGGSLMGMLVGGPLGGAVIGTALGFASKSERFQDFIFGKIGEDGERRDGLIPKFVQDAFKGEDGKKLKQGALGGAALGLGRAVLFSKSGGLLGAMVGGPLAGAVIGAGAGILTRSKLFHEFLFGDGKPDSWNKGIVPTVQGIWKKWTSNDKGEADGGKLLGMSGVGAGVGALTGAVIGKMGLLGAMASPLGPVGGALMGLAFTMKASQKGFKEWLFGTTDENGNKHVGVLGKFTNMLNGAVFNPLKDQIELAIMDARNFIKYDIMAPIQFALEPFAEGMRRVAESIHNAIDTITRPIKNLLLSSVNTIVDTVESFIINPIKKVTGGFFKAIGGLTKTVIGAPFRVLEMLAGGQNYQNKRDSRRRTMRENREQYGLLGGTLRNLGIRLHFGEAYEDASRKYNETYEPSDWERRREAYKEERRNVKEASKRYKEQLKQRRANEELIRLATGNRYTEDTLENRLIAQQLFEEYRATGKKSSRTRKLNKFADRGGKLQFFGNDIEKGLKKEDILRNVAMGQGSIDSLEYKEITEQTSVLNKIKDIVSKIVTGRTSGTASANETVNNHPDREMDANTKASHDKKEIKRDARITRARKLQGKYRHPILGRLLGDKLGNKLFKLGNRHNYNDEGFAIDDEGNVILDNNGNPIEAHAKGGVVGKALGGFKNLFGKARNFIGVGNKTKVVVGEEGAETLELPNGTKVTEADKAKQEIAAARKDQIARNDADATLAAKKEKEKEEEEKQYRFGVLGKLTDFIKEQKEHHTVWNSIFSKKGLITAGALLLGSRIIKFLNTPLGELLKTLGGGIVKGVEWAGGKLLEGFEWLKTDGIPLIQKKFGEVKDYIKEKIWPVLEPIVKSIDNMLGRIVKHFKIGDETRENGESASDRAADELKDHVDLLTNPTVSGLKDYIFDDGKITHETGVRSKVVTKLAATATNSIIKHGSDLAKTVTKTAVSASKAGGGVLSFIKNSFGGLVAKIARRGPAGKAAAVLKKLTSYIDDILFKISNTEAFIGAYVKITEFVEKVTAATGAVAATGAGVVAILAKEATWVALGALNGATGAKRLFRIDSNPDGLMVAISTAMGGLAGTTVGTVVEFVAEVVDDVIGVNMFHEIATMAYQLFGGEERYNKLIAEEDAYFQTYLNEKEESITEQYKTHLNMKGLTEDQLSYEDYKKGINEGKYGVSVDSFSNWNVNRNQTLGYKLGNAVLKKGGAIKDFFAGSKQEIKVDPVTGYAWVADKNDPGMYHVFRKLDGDMTPNPEANPNYIGRQGANQLALEEKEHGAFTDSSTKTANIFGRAGAGIKAAGSWISDKANTAGKWASETGTKISNWGAGVANKAGELYNAAGEFIQGGLDIIGNKISDTKKIAKDAISGMGKSVEQIVKNFNNKSLDAADYFSADVNKIPKNNPLYEFGGGILTGAKFAAFPILTVNGIFNKISDRIKTFVGNSINTVAQGVGLIESDYTNLETLAKNGDVMGVINAQASVGDNGPFSFLSHIANFALKFNAVPNAIGVLIGNKIREGITNVINTAKQGFSLVSGNFNAVKEAALSGDVEAVDSIEAAAAEGPFKWLSDASTFAFKFVGHPVANFVAIGKTIGEFINANVDKIKNTETILKNNWTKYSDIAKQGDLQALFNAEDNSGDGVLGWVVKGVSFGEKLINSPFAAFHGIAKVVSEKINAAKTYGANLKQQIGDYFEKAKAYTNPESNIDLKTLKFAENEGDPVVTIVGGVAKSVIDMYVGIVRYLKEIWHNIKNAPELALEYGKGKLSEGWESFKTKVNEAATDFMNAGRGGRGGLDIPYFSQNDSRWANMSYGNESMSDAGCGPTAMAMVASGLNTNTDPVSMADYARRHGFRDESGTNWNFIDSASGAAGLTANKQAMPTGNFIRTNLSKGKPVILSGQGGAGTPYSSGGHYVVATGISGNNVSISDPRGESYSGVYPMEAVTSGANMGWGFSRNRGGRGGRKPKPIEFGFKHRGRRNRGGRGNQFTAEDVCKIALSQIGYEEKASASQLDDPHGNPGKKNHTKYEKEVFGSSGNYWCASFVCWCFYKAAGDDKARAKEVLGSLDMYCPTVMSGLQNKGGVDKNPKVGDCIFFSGKRHAGANHIGIVVGVNGSTVTTVEGNTSSSEYSDNGGCVASHTYDKNASNIIGFGHPAYDGESNFNMSSVSGSTSSSSSSNSGSSSFGGSILGGPLGKLANFFTQFASKVWTGVTTDVWDSNYDLDSSDGSSSGSSSSGTTSGSSAVFPKYNLNDQQIRGIANIVAHEQGSKEGMYAEASQIANLTDISGDDNATPEKIVAKVKSGWYKDGTSRYENPPSNLSATAIQAVKDVIVGGKRILPRYINEHDCITDIGSVSPGTKGDKSSWIPHETIVKQSPSRFKNPSSWIFYGFPGDDLSGKVDPFGYTSKEYREKYGDGHYTIDGTPVGIVESSGDGTGGTANLSGDASSRLKTIYNYFHDKGVPDAGIAGILGNIAHEAGSDLNPARVEGALTKRIKTLDSSWMDKYKGYGVDFSSKSTIDKTYTDAIDQGKMPKEEFVYPLKGAEFNGKTTHQYGYGLTQFTSPSYKEQLFETAKSKKVSISDINAQLEILEPQFRSSGVWDDLTASGVTPESAAKSMLLKYEKPDGAAEKISERGATARKYYNTISNGGAKGGRGGDNGLLGPWEKNFISYGRESYPGGHARPLKGVNTAQNTPQLNIINAARSQLGVMEEPENIQDYASATGASTGAEWAWCSSFVNWVFKQVLGDSTAAKALNYDKQKSKGKAAFRVAEMMDAFINSGQFFTRLSGTKPQPGDLVIYRDNPGGKNHSHIGLVESYDSSTDKFRSVEGNTSPALSGFDRNGGMVAEKEWGVTSDADYQQNGLTGFARPDWSLVYSDLGIKRGGNGGRGGDWTSSYNRYAKANRTARKNAPIRVSRGSGSSIGGRGGNDGWSSQHFYAIQDRLDKLIALLYSIENASVSSSEKLDLLKTIRGASTIITSGGRGGKSGNTIIYAPQNSDPIIQNPPKSRSESIAEKIAAGF